MSDLAQLREDVAASYNEVTYESMPFYFTHPAQLFTLGHLFKLGPPPIENARILELGCAAGGNIIPIAYHYPQAEVVGIDLAQKQVDIGLKQIHELGLTNITLKQQSILEFPESAGKFDYIITHGVFSWVDKEIQHKILQICHDHLTPKGIAYISYNTLPGWNMAKNVRDLMQWHTKSFKTPGEKVQQARAVLKFLTDGLKDDKSPYAEFLKSEIQLLSKQSDHYLLHEHLEHFNEPMYFHEFMSMAQSHKLGYLCDTNLSLMYRENLVPAFANELSKVNDSIVLGQYMDFMRNQRFRCTLLNHQTTPVDRNIEANDIESFYIQLTATCQTPGFNEQSIHENKNVSFVQGALTYTVQHPLSQMAMLILMENQLRPMHYKDLCEALMKRGQVNNIGLVKKHLNLEFNLMRLVFAGIISLTMKKPNYSVSLDEKPVVCPLARTMAQHARHVSNRRHQPVMLDPLSQLLIPLTDGTRTLEDMVAIVTENVQSGKLSVMDPNKQLVIEPNKRADLIKINCNAYFQNLKQQALLVDPKETPRVAARRSTTEEMVH